MRLTNNAEGGTSGTTVTTGNSGGSSGTAWVSVTTSAGNVLAYSNTVSAHGSLAYRMNTGGSAAQTNILWDSTVLGSSVNRLYGRLYFYLSDVNQERELIRFRRNSTQVARVRYSKADGGFIELRQGNSSAPATSGGTGTVALSASTWYRLEWDIQAGTLTNTLYLYLGDSSTLLETIAGTGVFAGSGVVNEVGFGQFTATASLADAYFDDIVATDTALPGPVVVAGAASLSAASGLTAAGTHVYPGAAVLSAASGLSPAMTSSTLTEDTTVTLSSPERGVFYYSETHYLSDNSGYTALNATTMASNRASTGESVVFRYFVMEKYLTVDTLDTAWINLVAADLDACRTAGVKMVARFTYSTSGDVTAPYGDAPVVARVLGHIKQLRTTLAAGADVILAVQAGFIGMWGEWYYTDNYGDLGTMTAAQWADRKAVLSYLLSLDSRIPILVRYVGLKNKLLNESNALTAMSADFSSQDSVNFNGWGTGITVSGGQLRQAPSVSGTYLAIASVATANLVGHAVQVEAAGVLNTGNGSTEQFLEYMAPDFNNRFVLGKSGGSLLMRVATAGSSSDTTLSFDATAHRWWRIRENAGTATFETSPDGVTWTVRRTVTHTLTASSSSCYVRLEAGFWGTEPSPGTAIFDNLSTAYLPPDDALSRIGFHNDAFLASSTDFGTYSTFSSLTTAATRAYTAYETARPLPMGGESAASNSPTSDWTNASVELAAYRWTFLNPSYEPTVLASWGSNLDEAKRRLGYRLVASQVRVSDPVKPGDTARVEVSLVNDGYAAPLTLRDVVLLLDDQAGHRYEQTVSVDPRTWAPTGRFLLSADIAVPGGAPVGTYHAALWLPDGNTSLRSRADYAIRLANTGTWNSTYGYNELATLSVAATVVAATVSMSAASGLTASGVVTAIGAVALTAASGLIAASGAAFTASAALSAATGLTAAAVQTQPAIFTLTADSGLSAAAVPDRQAAATLSGASGLSGTAVATGSGATALSAASGLTAAAIRLQPAAAGLDSASGLTVSAVAVGVAAAGLTAASTIAAAAVTDGAAAAAMTAASGLTGAATRVVPAASGLTAAAGLAAAGVPVALATTPLAAASGLTATALRVVLPTVTLQANSSLTADALVTALAAATLSAGSDLSATGLRTVPAAADLTATGEITAVGQAVAAQGALLSAATGLSAAAVRDAVAAAAVAAASGLAASATATGLAATGLTATSGLIAAVVPVAIAQATFSAGGALNVGALVIGPLAFTLTASGVLTTGTVSRQQSAGTLLSAATGFATVARRQQPAAVDLSSASALVAAGAAGEITFTALAAAGALTAGADRVKVAGPLTLSSVSGMTAFPSLNANVFLAAMSGATVFAAARFQLAAAFSAAAVLTAAAFQRLPSGTVELAAATNLSATAQRQILLVAYPSRITVRHSPGTITRTR